MERMGEPDVKWTTASPTHRRFVWFVWDMYDEDRKPIFIGPMEDCILMSDALNSKLPLGGHQ